MSLFFFPPDRSEKFDSLNMPTHKSTLMNPFPIPPDGKPVQEQQWDHDDMRWGTIRPNLQSIGKLELIPNGLHQTIESVLAELQTVQASVCFSWHCTNHSLTWHLLARNESDYTLSQKTLESAIPYSLVEPGAPIRSHPFYRRIETIEQNVNEQSLYKLFIQDVFCSDKPYHPLVPSTIASKTVHPLQMLPSITTSLRQDEAITVDLIVFPASQSYWSILREQSQKDKTMEDAQLRHHTRDNLYGLQYRQEVIQKLEHPKPLMSFYLRISSLLKWDDKVSPSTPLQGLYHKYLHGTRPLQHITQQEFANKIPANEIRDALKYKRPLLNPGILTTTEIAKLMPLANLSMLNHDFIPVVKAHPAYSPKIDAPMHLPVGVDPENSDRAFCLPILDGANMAVTGIPGVGKTTLMLSLAERILHG